jgi:hypothetical protein
VISIGAAIILFTLSSIACNKRTDTPAFPTAALQERIRLCYSAQHLDSAAAVSMLPGKWQYVWQEGVDYHTDLDTAQKMELQPNGGYRSLNSTAVLRSGIWSVHPGTDGLNIHVLDTPAGGSYYGIFALCADTLLFDISTNRSLYHRVP